MDDVNKRFMQACRNNDAEFVRSMINKEEVECSCKDKDALLHALLSGSNDVVSVLLNDVRINPRDDDVLSVHYAVSGMNEKKVAVFAKDIPGLVGPETGPVRYVDIDPDASSNEETLTVTWDN